MKKIAVFSSHAFEAPYLTEAAKEKFELAFIHEPLSAATVELARGSDGIAIFTSDDASKPILEQLAVQGVFSVATRSAGYDHISLKDAGSLGIKIANVPGYSPHAIAEFSVALMLALSRHLKEALQKVNDNDFTIDALTGMNLHHKTAGIIGTGRIGAIVCKILHGFGCRILATDISPDKSLESSYGVEYVSREELCSQSDIISIHTPLTENTTYLLNKELFSIMKDGVMIINTSRGKIINTNDLIEALRSGKAGCAGLDVYENEKEFYFKDYSKKEMKDETLRTLIGLKNVIVTAHQAFLTKEALKNIADTTIMNLDCLLSNKPCSNLLQAE